jgi:hypothetical protein
VRARILVAFAAVVSLLVGCGGGDTTTIIQQAPPTTSVPPTGQAQAAAVCGEITFANSPTTIVVLRGAECSEAINVASLYAASTGSSRWQCALAHEPFDKYTLPDGTQGIIGFSCGYGQASGNLRAAPHAFIGVTTRTAPAPSTTPTEASGLAPGSEHIANPTASDYREPLSVWPTYDVQTKGSLSALFIENNPNDCGALSERFEDAPIGVQQFVDRAANEPRLQDDPISNAMLVYCQKFSGG